MYFFAARTGLAKVVRAQEPTSRTSRLTSAAHRSSARCGLWTRSVADGSRTSFRATSCVGGGKSADGGRCFPSDFSSLWTAGGGSLLRGLWPREPLPRGPRRRRPHRRGPV